MTRRFGVGSFRGALVAGLLLSGCGTDGIGLLVDLRTDYVPGSELASVETELVVGTSGDGRTTSARTVTTEARAGDDLLTGLRVGDFGGLGAGPHQVRVRLLRPDGSTLAVRSMVVELRESREVTVLVTRDCAAVECPGPADAPTATECLGGRCVEPGCDPDTPDSCGVSACAADADCGRSGCTVGRCVSGACLAQPDDSACPVGLRCEPSRGCVPATDGGVAPGTPCASAADCDDLNPCTDDSCTPGGCIFAPGTAGCDDGVFCNGNDRCEGGACTVHAGDPCGGGAECDEGRDRCIGCSADADCGSASYGGWGGCQGFSDACDESGRQSRSVTTFRCIDGTCQASESSESRDCGRSTGGDACGTDSCTAWSACAGFADACAEAGTQDRECTRLRCSGGSCVGSVLPETAGCTRVTTGGGCTDGNICTVGDTCMGGACVAGPDCVCGVDCPPRRCRCDKLPY